MSSVTGPMVAKTKPALKTPLVKKMTAKESAAAKRAAAKKTIAKPRSTAKRPSAARSKKATKRAATPKATAKKTKKPTQPRKAGSKKRASNDPVVQVMSSFPQPTKGSIKALALEIITAKHGKTIRARLPRVQSTVVEESFANAVGYIVVIQRRPRAVPRELLHVYKLRPGSLCPPVGVPGLPAPCVRQ